MSDMIKDDKNKKNVKKKRTKTEKLVKQENSTFFT